MNYKNTVKKEKDVFKKDLSNDSNSYTYYLDRAIKANAFADVGDDLMDLKKFVNKVLEVIAPAKDTNAKRNFIVNLQRKRDFIDAQMYVYDACLKGQGLGVI